jgi:hypothetical protein
MHTEDSALPANSKTGTIWVIAAAVCWLSLAVGGLYVVWAYDNSPGLPAQAGPTWPQQTALARATDRPTVVFLAHPLCDCTKASLGELAEALARATVKPQTYVVFLKPSSMPEGWEKSALWESATKLPFTTIIRDDDGREAEHFGALTSGQTMVYDATGNLRFSGGITSARAHAGDNAGRSAVVAILNDSRPPHPFEGQGKPATNVYGCSLFASAKS